MMPRRILMVVCDYSAWLLVKFHRILLGCYILQGITNKTMQQRTRKCHEDGRKV